MAEQRVDCAIIRSTGTMSALGSSAFAFLMKYGALGTPSRRSPRALKNAYGRPMTIFLESVQRRVVCG